MEIRRFSFVLEAESPIAHHSETFGNTQVLMDRKIRQRGGGFAKVPIITADTMRHGMREAASWALLDAAGMLANPVLSEGALRLLFAGGMVTGRGDAGTIKLDQYKRLADLVPPLRLFGGCCDNRVIPGNLQVQDAVLICDESEHYRSGWVRDWLATDGGNALAPSRSHIEEVQRVRMDPTLHPSKQRLLAPTAQAALTGKLAASEAAHEDNDARGREESKSSMMPRRFETLAQGSLFEWAVTATTYTPLDVDTLLVSLGCLFRHFTVGGKKATGHGRLRVVAGRELQVLRPADAATVVDLTGPNERVGRLFGAHVKEHAAELATYLASVNA